MIDRGQTFTLEAFVAALLLLAAVAFALQVVSVSSNTAGAGGQEVRAQHAGLAEGVLDEGAANGTLRTTLLYWNETEEQFYGADAEPVDGGFYIARSPPTRFGNATAAMFDDRRVRYNIDLYVFNETENGLERERQRLVESGTPSDDATRVVETVTLYNDTHLVDETETRTNVTLGEVNADENSSFYAPDVRPNSRIYTVIRVEVVLWRT
jgi:hypothetical protein